MEQTSEAILALKPVTFRYKNYKRRPTAIWPNRRRSSQGERRFGNARRERRNLHRPLRSSQRDVAQRVLKEHRKVQEQEATIAPLRNDLQVKVTRQQKQIEALTAGLPKSQGGV